MVNQCFYEDVLIKLKERFRKKRPDLCEEWDCVLHQNNTPVHRAFSVLRKNKFQYHGFRYKENYF